MKKLILGLSLGATALAGGAYAATAHRHGADPDGDRTITRAEAQTRAEAMFARFDVNKDGKIDAADRAAHQTAIFDSIDTNHDGSISRDEFANAHPHGHDGADGPGGPPPAMQGQGMAQGMGGHGMDHDGMGRHGMGGHGMGMMMLQMADTNKDGAVSKDEFVAAHLKHFDTADTNHDGKLTPAERKAAFGKMRAMIGGHGDWHGKHGTPPAPPPAN